MDVRPLVAHVIYRFDVGGLENGLVNIVNGLPAHEFRHAIICLDDFSEFRRRLSRSDVPIIALHKKAGKDPKVYLRLWRALRELKPAVLHTRNFPALDSQFVGALAGVPHRVHGEHGRDVFDLQGRNRKYKLLRTAARPFIHRYVTVTADLREWLVNVIGITASSVVHIPNGVDTNRFHPGQPARDDLYPPGFLSRGTVVVGTVGRMAAVKDPLTLVRAFLHLLDVEHLSRDAIRLVMIGDGVLRDACVRLLSEHGALDLAWLPGERQDTPEILRALDVFVLPSLAEGASNTILEAMASGLPVVATNVGGTPELVSAGKTGTLVPASDPVTMASAIKRYVDDGNLRTTHGMAGRQRAVRDFSLTVMVERYRQLYASLVQQQNTGAVRCPDATPAWPE